MKRVTELLLGPAHKVRPSFASYIGVIRVVGPLLRKDEPPKISRVA